MHKQHRTPEHTASSRVQSKNKQSSMHTVAAKRSSMSRMITTKASNIIQKNKNITTVTGIVAGSSIFGTSYARRKVHNNTIPAEAFRFDPLLDFPMNQKEVVMSPDGSSLDHVKSTHGAISLTFDTPGHPSARQTATAQRPLRMAVASTGLSKELVKEVTNHGQTYLVWEPNQLTNFAVAGEDTAFLTGEDALVSGHCSSDGDTRHSYKNVDTSNKGLFLHKALPLPVVEPIKKDGTDGNTHSAVIGVADGVGGMASFGDANQTKVMSHQLVRLVRHHMTNDTTSARELLGQAYFSLIANNNVSLGACTASIGLIKPLNIPREPEDTHDDGKRLNLSIANCGDSCVVALRPKHCSLKGTTSYVPLAMSWPMHHRWNTDNPPPFQFALFEHPQKPPVSPLHPDIAGTDGMTTSHYSTPSYDATDTADSVLVPSPSGGQSIYISPKQYRDVLGGRARISDYIRNKNKYDNKQLAAFDLSIDVDGDYPWMAQGVDQVELRRGDIVCAFSDGIADNLRTAIFTHTVAEVWESVVGYVNPAIRLQHPATRNVRSFRYDNNTKRSLGQIVLHPTHLNSSDDNITSTMLYHPDEEVKRTLDNITDHDSKIAAGQQAHLDLLNTTNIYDSKLDENTETVVAGSLASMLSGGLVRLSQKGYKVDDMSVVVGVVY